MVTVHQYPDYQTVKGRDSLVSPPMGPDPRTGAPFAGSASGRADGFEPRRHGFRAQESHEPRAPSLLGRDHEAATINRLLTGLHSGVGGALVVRGEVGIGKTALLAEASGIATEQGTLVLSTGGVQSESDLRFAGLHQLLRPIPARFDDLSSSQSPLMRAAFGRATADAPELYPIALGALDLLSEAAARAPVVLIAEDVQWLDRPAADVLAFIGRRVEADPIVLLVSIREGYDSPLLEARLPELHLDGLAEDAAHELLEAHFPDLAPDVCGRLLGEAEGNPLALLELPAALGATTRGGQAALPARLPLTERLERAFASRAAELPDATRTLLRIAAADDSSMLGEIMQAAEIADGVQPTVHDLVPAIRAQLIEVDGQTVRFRRSLVRSAIYQAATLAERHAAHAALVEVLADDPGRGVWHKAAVAVGKDPALAAELEETACRARRSGRLTAAVAAFERAADCGTDAAKRGGLLLRAAEAASELGRSETVRRLLRQANSAGLGPRERAFSIWLGDAFRRDSIGDPAGVHALVETANRMSADGDTDLALNLLSAAAFRCYWSAAGKHAGREVLRATDRVSVPPDDPRLIQIYACTAPIERSEVILGRLLDPAPDQDPDYLYLLGTAACLVGAFSKSLALLGTLEARLHEHERPTALARVLATKAWSALLIADLAVATPVAEEAAKLAAETAQPMWLTVARTAQAALAALRGEQAAVEDLTAEAGRMALSTGAPGLLAMAQYARGLSALGQGRHADAYDELRRLCEAGELAHHHLRCYAIGDLAEAAVRSGHREHGRAVLAELEPLIPQTPSPGLHVAIMYARAVLADDQDAEAVFDKALRKDLTSWPFIRARLQLALGEWLRRRRRPSESRIQLRAARDAFDALGIIPWAERAQQELLAAGETSPDRTPQTRDQLLTGTTRPTSPLGNEGEWGGRRSLAEPLTDSEARILRYLPSNLTAPEIARQLCLSVHTVTTHMRHIYTKLGAHRRHEAVELARGLGLLAAFSPGN